ncbi:MAG TPA: hexose kinase [Microbacteriaceae bacterium]|nr:hexose kinase [Microbacteriaceae bacterium]
MSGHVVIVTANPAVDVTYGLAVNKPGETNRVQRVVRRAGGKGLNVAHVLTALGVEARSVLPAGGDAGSWLRAELSRDPAVGAIDVVPIGGLTRQTVAIVADAGHPTLYVEPGPRLTAEEWDRVADAVAKACEGAAFLVVSGSLPAGAPGDLVGRWVRAARARGARSLVDCSGPALVASAEAEADIIKPNEAELLAATGAATLEAGVAQLRRCGAGRLVVSRGAEGLLVFDGEARALVPAVPGVTGNPTGAGDAAAAGLVAALVRGYPLEAAARWAGAAGAAAVRQPVAGVIDTADFDAYVEALGGPRR